MGFWSTDTSQDELRLPGGFRVFCSARLVALAGSTVTGVALPLLVLGSSKSSFVTSLVTVAMTVPYLLFGLIAGAVADKVRRRRIILAAQSISICALLSVPIIELTGDVSPVHALAVSFVCGTSFVWFDSACFGAIPVLVQRRQLVKANTVLWVSGSLIEATFPALAGILIALVGAAYAISVEGLALLLSVILFSRISSSLDAVDHTTNNYEILSVRCMIRDGIEFIWHHDLVRILTLVGAASSFINGMIIGLLAVISKDVLNISEDDPRAGAVWVAVSFGTVIGASLLPILRRWLRLGMVSMAALASYPVVLIGFVVVPLGAIRLFLLGCWGAVVSLVVLNGISSRQEVTPASMQSRVNTTARMVAWGGTPFGALLGGVVSNCFGICFTLIVAAGLAFGVSVFALRSHLPSAGIKDVSNAF